MNISAIIIAGGKGTRLAKYTKEIPKPMIPINNKPILEWQIEEFRRYGIKHIIVTVGHLKEIIMDYFGDGRRFGISVNYIEEKDLLGSAGSFYYLKDMIDETFFCVYGDVLFSVSLPKMLQFHRQSQALATLLVHPNSHPQDSDIVLLDSRNKVRGFLCKNEKRHGLYYSNIVNAGLFLFEPQSLDYFAAPQKLDLEKDFIQSLVGKHQIAAYKTTEYIKDMGTLKRLASVESHAKLGIVAARNLDGPQKCIFLDRDGTVNKYKGFITSPDMLELEDCATDAIKKINDSGYLAIVITNQPVIARGDCTFEELGRIHQKLDMLLGNHGAYVDALYFCPHHPDRGYEGEREAYKIKCNCRKPNIGMIEQAVNDYNIDLTQSFIIGDSTVDIQAGKNAGIKTVLLKTGEGGKDGKYEVSPNYVAENLRDAVDLILRLGDSYEKGE